jgi:hypothetical protein
MMIKPIVFIFEPEVSLGVKVGMASGGGAVKVGIRRWDFNDKLGTR